MLSAAITAEISIEAISDTAVSVQMGNELEILGIIFVFTINGEEDFPEVDDLTFFLEDETDFVPVPNPEVGTFFQSRCPKPCVRVLCVINSLCTPLMSGIKRAASSSSKFIGETIDDFRCNSRPSTINYSVPHPEFWNVHLQFFIIHYNNTFPPSSALPLVLLRATTSAFSAPTYLRSLLPPCNPSSALTSQCQRMD